VFTFSLLIAGIFIIFFIGFQLVLVILLLLKIYIKLGSGFCPISTTAQEISQIARCNNCGVKGNNTYQIVYTGNSDVAMDGAGVRSAKDAD
jgi:hypothetical protein